MTELDDCKSQLNSVYAERNKCVSLIARMAIALGINAGIGKHGPEDEAWEGDWRNIIFIDLPNGQVSWHIHDSDLPLFDLLGEYKGQWDGHSTEEKYQRVQAARFTDVSLKTMA